MAAVKRAYLGTGFTGDYQRVRTFLADLNRREAVKPGFLWGRWEWFFSLSFNALDPVSLARIGIWEDGGRVVALATYEGSAGEAYLCVDPAYRRLLGELLAHAEAHMVKDFVSRVLVPDTDRELQREAFARGYRPTQQRECNAALDLQAASLNYTLPEGFRVVSLRDDYDLRKYNRVLWKGFNHGDNPPETDEAIEDRRLSLSGPTVDLSLKIAVAAPDGEFVSYCGMWHEPGEPFALVEPVATDPAFRRLGLGRAAVLEGARRCALRGAKTAFVGSSQQFYYSIGFTPYSTETFWEKKVQ